MNYYKSNFIFIETSFPKMHFAPTNINHRN